MLLSEESHSPYNILNIRVGGSGRLLVEEYLVAFSLVNRCS
jgi:hypothetical protein